LSEPSVITVVGAGIAGLAAAAELAERANVRIIERLPAPGGTWEFDHPVVEALVRDCDRRGVRMEWGHTALRWRDGRLLVIGPGRREWVTADHLVFAGGTRPATPAEIRLFGARAAGVFVATVAHHLLQGRVDLGRRIVLCGTGYWADVVVAHLPPGTVVELVGDGPLPPSPAGVTVHAWRGHSPVEVIGADRVQQLVIRSGAESRVLPCDSVVLAGDLRPLRNVDGAIGDAPDVTYVQPTTATLTAEEAMEFAQKTVSALTAKEQR
jgi:NADPH-dependent 2,4-dienoyl-CoA reductase/sulfur reductase-like enzyme